MRPDVAATAMADVSAAHRQNLVQRVVGVFFTPRATYADVASRPRWFGVLALVVVIAAVGVFAFTSTDVGKQALLDQQVRTMESFGFTINDAQYQRMQDALQFAPYTGAAGQIIVLPLMTLIAAGILLGVFNALLGGDASFKQVFATVAHANVVLSLSQIFSLPLAYARETMSTATNLAVFFPFLDENSVAARFLGTIDLIWVWWMVSLSIGLGVLYKKRTGPIATTLLIVYAAIALVLAAIRTALSGA